MRPHVSAEVLARYQEGDLGARRAAKVAAHLSGCRRCDRAEADLAAVSGLLAEVGQPTMPAAVAERLQFAIASESAARAAGQAVVDGVGAAGAVDAAPARAAAGRPETGAARPASAPAGERTGQPADVPGRPGLPERRLRRRWPQLRWPVLPSPALLRGTVAAAVVVVLLGVGFVLVRGTAGPSSKATGSVPAAGSGGSNDRKVSGQASAGLTGTASLHYRLHGKIVTTTAVRSRLNFTRAGLGGQVRREVASHPVFAPVNPAPHDSAGSTSGPAATMLLPAGVTIGALNGCLSDIAAGRRVLVTVIARYLGKPATIIVLRSPTAKVLDVAIVGLACSASAPHYIVRTTVPAG